MKKYLIVATVLMLLLVPMACTSSTPAATSPPVKTPSPSGTIVITTTPIAGTLSLTISQPQNESVVSESLLTVSGQTAPDAVLSINGDMVPAIDANGNFTAVVSLVEGPNVIDAIATDYSGNQASQELVIIYTP